jgi:GTPase involved in cell partitioning and DNA repair
VSSSRWCCFNSCIAELAGISIGHVQNAYAGSVGLGEENTKKVKDVENLLHLIDGKPSDTILLKYELSQLTGLSMEELEDGEKKAERRIELEALKSLPMEPTNLRKTTLKNLEKMRENGYMSVYRPNISYDPKEVDAEISRKIFNAKRKQEIWEEKMSLNA